MRTPWQCGALLAALVTVLRPIPASAQLYESVGTRAQGMSGAFVAVADDATASWWNPAGIATGSVLNMVFEKGQVTEPDDPGDLQVASRTKTSGWALAFPALGASFYRARVSEALPDSPTGAPPPTRQDVGESSRVRSLSTTQFGATIGQSLGAHLVVASTIKVMRGGVGVAPVDPAQKSLDQADDLDPDREFAADLDLGAMVSFGHVRFGVSMRNVTTPEFGEGEAKATLERQARAGVALHSGKTGLFDALTVAADLDLTRTATLFGDVRHAAAGIEAVLAGKRVAVRGGVARNTVGDPRPSTSTGISFALLRGIYLEAARTFGSDDSLRGWGSSVRIAF